MSSNRFLTPLVAVILTGCPTSNSDPPPDAVAAAEGGADRAGAPGDTDGGVGGRASTPAGRTSTDAAAAGIDGAADGAPVLTVQEKPLAIACAANAECASGFCVDGVCCNTACDGQCFSCNEPGQMGYCTAQLVGDDLNATQPCTGAHTCGIALVPVAPVACRLKNEQACHANADCTGLNCQTFFVDDDRDGYGNSLKALHLCVDAGANPPGGYAAQAGDCCDSDAKAFPGQASYFATVDACGSWDYSCDGTIEGATGASTMSSVPASECGTTVHGSCTSCTQTVVCH